MIRLSPSMNRFLAVALLVGALAVPYWLVIDPLITAFAGHRETIDHNQEMVASLRQIAASRDQFERQMEQIRKSPLSQDAYLSGASETLVAAQLQNRVKSVVEANGGTLNSTQIMQTENEDSFQRIGIRVRMAGDTEALQEIFHALEAGSPYLFINNVDISARQARRRRDRPSAATDSALNVTFEVFGYMRLAVS